MILIVTPVPKVEFYTDTSLQSWGGHVDSLSMLGYWTYSEKLLHINKLELEAVFHALQSFVQTTQQLLVRGFLSQPDTSQAN